MGDLRDDYHEYHRQRNSRNRSTQSREEASGSRAQSQNLSTHIPESPTSAAPPNEMTIEDFVSQRGRERLRRLDPDYIGNSTWFEESGNGISKSILRMMYGLLKLPYATYTSMPKRERDIWFKQFAQDFNWDPNLSNLVRVEFDEKAAIQYSRTVNEWKQKWLNDETPKNVNEKVFEGLQAHWRKPETKTTSSTASKNRMSVRGGKGISIHNGGATSYFTRKKQLTTRDGVVPDHLTLMEDTHTNKKTKQIQDGVAKEVIQHARKRREEYISSQPSVDGDGLPTQTQVPTEMMNQIILEETPKNKGRIFGLGSLGKRCGSHSTSSSEFRFRNPELEQALQDKDDRIEALEKLMEKEKEANQREKEENQRSIQALEKKMEKEKEENERRQAEFAKFKAEILAQLPCNS